MKHYTMPIMVTASDLVSAGTLPAPRFAPYEREALGNLSDADSLYKWHGQMASSCMELISHFEVLLRNSIDSTLAQYFRESDRNIPWFLMNTKLAKDLSPKVNEARVDAARYNFESRDHIVSRLMFGFWANMLSRKHDELWQKTLHNAFPNARRPRNEVMSHIEGVRLFRNRVAHHDSLLGVNIPFEVNRIFTICGWINSDAETWIRSVSRCHAAYSLRPVNPSNTVIVPAKTAWKTYQKTGAYVCQPGRFFRDVSRMAFYSDKAVQASIPEVLDRRDHVPWTENEAQRLDKTGNLDDRRVAKVIREVLKLKDSNGDALYADGLYQVFILSDISDIVKTKTLNSPVQHTKTGKGSAYVRKQRYCTSASILHASTTDDIS